MSASVELAQQVKEEAEKFVKLLRAAFHEVGTHFGIDSGADADTVTQDGAEVQSKGMSFGS